MANVINTLLVEDNSDMAFLIESVVKKHAAYRFLANAGTLDEAKMLIAALTPDLVLLDNYLPDGTGVEMIQFIRTHYPTIDVIFITAANDIDIVKRAVRYGAWDYLVKPFLLERLHGALGNYVHYCEGYAQESHLQQSDIDNMLVMHAELDERTGVYPKGIDALTLDRVRSVFTDKSVEHTSDSLGEILGISKSTARRYLEYCKIINMLEAHIQHGCVGRPQRLYRLINTRYE